VKQINSERLREVLSYDAETGVFTWLAGSRMGKPAGTKNADGYIQIKIDGRLFYGHRLAWLYVHGEWPLNEVDHRNCTKSDNRIDNLRDATRTVNSENVQAAHKDSRSGLLGVSWSKDKDLWYSRIRVKGSTRFLGYFNDPNAAHAAYITEKRAAHEGSML
jgi:hypothetical protein